MNAPAFIPGKSYNFGSNQNQTPPQTPPQSRDSETQTQINVNNQTPPQQTNVNNQTPPQNPTQSNDDNDSQTETINDNSNIKIENNNSKKESLLEKTTKTEKEHTETIQVFNEKIEKLDLTDGVEDDEIIEPLPNEEDLKEDNREHINIVFIGHVDAGKSTLSGNILCLSGMVDRRTIEKYEKEAKENNRSSWYLAFILDTNDEERARGKTVECGRAHFSTPNKRYTILDAPGHRNYVPNMIIGVSQADVACLVISAKRGEFESGFEKDGQTREHAIIAKTVGVKKLVVVVNKMDEDTVNWSKDRYDDIQTKLNVFLRSIGYGPKDVTFVPVSGFGGANIQTKVSSQECPWWDGLSFLETLDNLPPLERNFEGPLRIPVLDKIKERGFVIIMGKIEAGIVTVGDVLMINPGKNTFTVVMIENDEGPLRRAKPGENVRIYVKASQLNEDFVFPGYVLTNVDSPTPVTDEFVAQIFIMNLLEHKSLFSAGYEAVLHLHTCVQEITVVKLLEQLDPKTMKPEKKFPKFAQNKGIVNTHIRVSKPICMERFTDCQQLGRFTIRDEGKTIAFGKILAPNAPQLRKKKK